MVELLGERSYARQVFLHDDARTRTGIFSVGHRFYLNETTGLMEPVDLTWQDDGTHWKIGGASYRLRVAKNFAAAQLIVFENRYGGAQHFIRFDPRSLQWIENRNFNTAQTIGTQQPVTGVVTGNVIRYSNAFGPGLHFEITLRRSGFAKEVVIDSFAALGTPPSSTAHVMMLARYEGAGLSIMDAANQVWNRSSLFERSDTFLVSDGSGRATFIHPAYMTDAADRQRAIPIAFNQRQSALWQVKILPRNVLTAATFPVRADTTTSFYAGAGDGWTNATDAVWNTCHDATDASSAEYTGTTTRVGIASTASYIIRRSFFPCDTSAIPDTDVISAATFYATTDTTAIQNNDNDGNNFIAIVGPTSQASNTSLVVGDFDQCGAIDNPQEVHDTGARRSLNAITNSTKYSWVLNATGLGIISKTGYTLLGMREGHDILDDTPGGTSTCRFYTSESNPTTQDDPYLEVTYAPAASTAGIRGFPRGMFLGMSRRRDFGRISR